MASEGAVGVEIPIPFHIEMRCRGRQEDDHVEHELKFGVVGVDEPVAVSVVSEGYLRPVISARGSRGGLRLNDALLDVLALSCFTLMAGLLLEQDGKSGSWTIADVTKLIRKQFQESEARRILCELSRQVRDRQHVRNVCLVSDDDNI
ncbi:MAG: hypothetical protein WBD40_04965 [Tepidisphaeraceae bacterium]